MIRVSEIRNQLVSYLASEIPYDQFEDWLIDQSWNMHKDSSPEAQEFVHAINASLFKYLDRYIDEASLREELLMLVQEQVASFTVLETRAPVIQQRWESQAVAYRAPALC